MRLRVCRGVGFELIAVPGSTTGATFLPVVVGELVDNITLCRPLRVCMDGQSNLLNVLVPVVAGLVNGRFLVLLLLLLKGVRNAR